MKGSGFIRLTLINRTTGQPTGDVAYVPWKEIVRIVPGPFFKGLRQDPVSSTLHYRDNSEDYVKEAPLDILLAIREDVG